MKDFEIDTADGVPLSAEWVRAALPQIRGVVLMARRRASGGGTTSESALLLVGHSSGGHLAGLAGSLSLCDGLALIAAGTCDWRDYPASQWPRLWTVWWLAVPLLLRFFGYLPGWAGVGDALPRGVAEEWRRWSLTRGYLFGDPSVDASGYQAFSKPLLALSFSDDVGFSPPKAVRERLARYSSSEVEHVEVKRERGAAGVGHFGFFRRRHSLLWPTVDAWLDRVSARHGLAAAGARPATSPASPGPSSTPSRDSRGDPIPARPSPR